MASYRRPYFALVLVVLALVAFMLALVEMGSARGASTCTWVGTQHRDEKNGRKVHDVLCSIGGRDYVNGRGGRDLVRGGKADDTVVGGDSHDRIIGGPGNDDLFATDGVDGDHVDGGQGFDNCYGEDGDIFTHCEHIVTVSVAEGKTS